VLRLGLGSVVESDIAIIDCDGIHTWFGIHVYYASCMVQASLGALKSIVEPGVISNEP
jgi:hypothetical protein